jgi:hypothetical protein
MRVVPALLALLALAAPAIAQDPDGEPGCAQANPCEVIVELDAQGILDLAPDTFATGDWVLFSIYNADAVEHTLRLDGHSFEATIPAEDIVDTQPIRLGEPGTYDLEDQPTGDTAAITVQEEEVFTSDTDEDDNGRGNPIPGPAPWLVLGLLAGAAAVVRRK